MADSNLSIFGPDATPSAEDDEVVGFLDQLCHVELVVSATDDGRVTTISAAVTTEAVLTSQSTHPKVPEMLVWFSMNAQRSPCRSWTCTNHQ
jgi:hypothetical protein